MFVEKAFEESDGTEEVVVERHQQVDVVEVFLASEAMGEVVAWVDGGAHFAAARAEEAEIAFAHLCAVKVVFLQRVQIPPGNYRSSR